MAGSDGPSQRVGEVGEGQGQVQLQAVAALVQVQPHQLGGTGEAPVERRAVDVQQPGGLLGLPGTVQIAAQGLPVRAGVAIQ